MTMGINNDADNVFLLQNSRKDEGKQMPASKKMTSWDAAASGGECGMEWKPSWTTARTTTLSFVIFP